MSVGGIIVALVCIVILLVGGKAIIDWMELGPPWRNLSLLIIGLLALLILLSQFGVMGNNFVMWQPARP